MSFQECPEVLQAMMETPAGHGHPVDVVRDVMVKVLIGDVVFWKDQIVSYFKELWECY